MKDKLNISDNEHRQLFKLPENYFEELPQQIQGKIPVKNNNLVTPIKWSVGLVGLALLFFLFIPTTQKTETIPIVISAQEAYDYLLQNDDLLDQDFLTDALVSNEVTINAASYYTSGNTQYINTDILNNITITHLDLEDYELED
jgi:hypothetical protein